MSDPEPMYLHWVTDADQIETILLDVDTPELALNAAKAKSFADHVKRARVGTLRPDVDQRWFAEGKPLGDPISPDRPITHIVPE